MPPGVLAQSASSSVFTVAATVPDEWVTLALGPSPIVRILGKFRSRQEAVTVSLNIVDSVPPAADRLAGEVDNTLLNVSIGNVPPGELLAAHVTFVVQRSWLEASGVHPWSVRINRFDEGRARWVVSPASPVDEDETSITYTTVLPGFSDVTISGGEEASARRFEVIGINVESDNPTAGADLVVAVEVRNTGGTAGAYPLYLWVNDTVEAVEVVDLTADQTKSVELRFTRPIGVYRARVDRLIRTVSVFPAPAVTATPSPVLEQLTIAPTAPPSPTTEPSPTRVPPTSTPRPTETATPTPTVILTPTVTSSPVPTPLRRSGQRPRQRLSLHRPCPPSPSLSRQRGRAATAHATARRGRQWGRR